MVYKIPLTVWILLLISTPIWTVFMVLTSLYTVFKVGRKTYFGKPSSKERPALLDDPQFGEHGYVSLENGIKIHYVAGGDTNKPLMLFLHGFPEFWFCWRHQLKHFNKSYRAVAVDMRGYGDSSKPDGTSSYTIDKLTDDIKLIIEALGYKDCTLVAHDWGGVVAWSVAGKYPEMITKLIVANGPHLATLVEEISSSISQSLKSWYICFMQVPYLAEIMFTAQDCKFLSLRKGASPEERSCFKYTFGQKGAVTPPINYYRALFRESYSYPTSRIPVPSLMIWGDQDQALNKAIAERHRQYTTDFELKYLKGASHFCQQEMPEEFNRLVEEFLE